MEVSDGATWEMVFVGVYEWDRLLDVDQSVEIHLFMIETGEAGCGGYFPRTSIDG